MTANWPALVEGAVPFLAGLYATALGYGLLVPSSFAQTPAARKILPHMKWIGPGLMLFGVVLGWSLHAASATTSPSAPELARSISARMTLPQMIDEVTRLDAVEGKAGTIAYHLTIRSRVGSDAERESVIQELREHVRNTSCTHPGYQELLRAGYAVEPRYSFEGVPGEYPITVVPEHCGF